MNCSRRNEQVVSQPFLFRYGLSSPPLDNFPFFLLSFPSFLLFIYLFLFFFLSSIFFPFTVSSFSSLSSSFAPSSCSSSSFFFLVSPHSIHLLTFPVVLPPLPSFYPFPPWVGENNAKRIIFYGHNKCRFKPLK